MSEPEKNPEDKDFKENKDDKKESENLLRIVDDLISHTNSTRRLFLVFIGSALFFAPVALVLGGVLLGHPSYNIRHLESGMPFPPHFPRSGPPPFIFMGISVFIVISVVFAGILLFIAIKEYSFFAKWNQRFLKYKLLKDKVDKELGED